MVTMQREVIGLIPAAGQATRVAPLPCSKELYPVALRPSKAGMRPKVAAHYLLDSLRAAGIRKAFVILREGKWDIPAYFKDGVDLLDLHLAYLIMRVPHGPPFTLDHAYPFVRDANIAIGFPDVVFRPTDAFVRLLARLEHTGADAVLGLFPSDKPERFDMVEWSEGGRVIGLRIKQPDIGLRYAWMIAVWTPTFTEFMHGHLDALLRSGAAQTREFHVGDVIQAAIQAGLWVDGVAFPEGECVDIGAPDILAQLHQGKLSLP